MKNNEIKRSVVNWELDDMVKCGNDSIDILDDVIQNTYDQFIKLIKFKQKFNNLNSLMEDLAPVNTNKDLVEIIEYVENEIVVFTTELFPINYFKLESYGVHVELKNMIIFSIFDKLKEINFDSKFGKPINNWEEAILLIQVNKIGQLTDFDNYFCKPFIDGIKKSKFIIDDNPRCLNIAYSNLISENQLIKLTLINKKFHKKYEEKIHKILIS